MPIIKIYRVKEKNLKNLELACELHTVADIRKANPDLVIAEMLASLKGMIKSMPNYSKIELSVASGKYSKNGYDEGDLSLVWVTYYKDINAFTKLISRHQTVKGDKEGTITEHGVIK